MNTEPETKAPDSGYAARFAARMTMIKSLPVDHRCTYSICENGHLKHDCHPFVSYSQCSESRRIPISECDRCIDPRYQLLGKAFGVGSGDCGDEELSLEFCSLARFREFEGRMVSRLDIAKEIYPELFTDD